MRGRVTNAEDQPVAGASVGVLGGGGWDLQRSFGRLAEHMGRGRYTDTTAEEVTNTALSVATRMGFLGEGAVTTGPDGRYELQGIPPGAFTVVVRHRDYALGQTDALELGEGASLEGVDVVLSRGASLHGRITDRFERPLAGAILIAVSPAEFSGDSSPGAALYQGIADEAGDYEILNMAGGGYLVSSLRGDAAMNPMAIASTFQFDLVNVPPDRRVRHDVVDQSAAACRVFGTVSSAGRPIGSGGIVAMSFEGESLLGVDVKATQVNADATYEFPGLAPGAYEFLYQGGESELRLDVEIPDLPEHRLDIELPWGGVEGRVVDELTGEPLPGCTLTLRGARDRTLDGLLAMVVY
ncbi:MAG: carboxypeptidase-like regulatory domain-containing protein, partial [Chloroflexi bacterium]|nr:carboxypeptidase-like regulatory domain-containing protein [Chloroflexota bacterium]